MDKHTQLKQLLNERTTSREFDILEEYKEILVEARVRGVIYKHIAEDLKKIGVTVSTKTLASFLQPLKGKVDDKTRKRKNNDKKREAVENSPKQLKCNAVEIQEQVKSNVVETQRQEIIWTDEQNAIFNCKCNLLKVEAVAGSGKTSTLIEFIKRNSDKKILYAVFNRAMQQEAELKFKAENIENCHPYTINSISFTYTKEHLYNNKMSLDRDHEVFTPEMFEKFDELKEHADKAKLYNKVYTHFCNSVHTNVAEYVKDADTIDFINTMNSEAIYEYNRIKINDVAIVIKNFYELQKNKRIKPTFNFTLKYFLETSPIITKYDYLLIDESQDLSPVMLAICFKLYECKKIFVGDSNQQLYAFRGAVNALQSDFLSHAKTLTLSISFRCGKNQEELIKNIWPNFSFVGGNISTATDKIDVNIPYTYLARTRAGVLSHAIENLDNTDKKMYVPSTVDFKIIKDLCLLYKGQNKKNGKIFKIYGYERWEELTKDIVDNVVYDFDLKNGFELISKHTPEEILKILDNITKRTVTKEDADICISTVHGFKGLEASQVKLADDFKDLEEIRKRLKYMKKNTDKYSPKEIKDFQEWVEQEEKVFYVAVTRSYGVLEFR